MLDWHFDRSNRSTSGWAASAVAASTVASVASTVDAAVTGVAAAVNHAVTAAGQSTFSFTTNTLVAIGEGTGQGRSNLCRAAAAILVELLFDFVGSGVANARIGVVE